MFRSRDYVLKGPVNVYLAYGRVLLALLGQQGSFDVQLLLRGIAGYCIVLHGLEHMGGSLVQDSVLYECESFKRSGLVN